MAGLDDIRGHRSSRRRRHARTSPSPRENDWTGTDEPRLPNSPRWEREGDIEPSGNSTTSHHRCPTSNRALVPRSSSMRTPNSAVPVLTRAATAPSRWPAYIIEEEDGSRSDSRRSGSRRDRSTPSAHLYRSTPDSGPSLETSLSESDEETEATVSTEDETERRPSEKVRSSRQHLHQHHDHRRAPRREDIIYEEDNARDTRHRSFVDRPRSSSQHSADRHGRPGRPQKEHGRRGSSPEESRSRSRSNRYIQ